MRIGPGKPRLTGSPLCLVLLAGVLAFRPSCQAQNEPAPSPAPIDPAAAALAGFDETTGIWFPPDAPREVYLERSDPNHDLIQDIQKAFKANPALRKAACALASDPKREVRSAVLEQSVRQRLTMFHMLCAGSEAVEREKQRSEDAWRENEARFERTRNAGHARTLSDEERRARFLEIDSELDQHTDVFDRLDYMFEMLGLAPQAETAVYNILNVSPFRNMPANSRFQDYLQRLFDRESSEGMPEAARYRMGKRSYLYLTNHLPEARQVTEGILADASLARWRTDNVAVLGFLDRLAGDVSALKRAAQTCPTPASEATSYADRPDGAYCYDLYFGLATRSIELNGEKAPARSADALEEVVSVEPTNWPRRATSIRYVVRVDPARGRALAEDLLRVPATIAPLGARLDALDDLGTASRKLHDFGRALAAFDHYLDLLRYKPVPIPPDLWGRLTSLPEQETGAPSLIERSGSLNISWALGEKVTTSVDAGDFIGARRAVEAFLANAFNFDRVMESEAGKERVAQLVDLEGLSSSDREALETYLEQETEAVKRAARDQARMTRSYLRSYGAALLKAGRPEEAKRVAAYLIAQPGGEHNLPMDLYPMFYGARMRGESLPPATRPWEALPEPGAATPRHRN